MNVNGNLEAAIVAAQVKNNPDTTINKKYLTLLEKDSALIEAIEYLGLLTNPQWLEVYAYCEGEK